MKEGREVQAC
jgi:hypothetical protein